VDECDVNTHTRHSTLCVLMNSGGNRFTVRSDYEDEGERLIHLLIMQPPKRENSNFITDDLNTSQ